MVLKSVLFGLLAGSGWGVADFAAAVVSRKVGVLSTVFGLHFVAVVVASLYLPFVQGMGDISLDRWGLLVGLGLLGLIIYLGWYRALQLGPIALIAPIHTGYAVVTVLLAVIFLGERLSGGQTLGTVAAICGIVFASVNSRGLRSSEGLISMGVLLGIGSTVGFGLFEFSIGVLSRELGWFLIIYLNRLLTLAYLTPAVVSRRERPWQHLTLPLAAAVVLMGISETGALMAFSRGSEVGVLSIVSAASTWYPAVPIIGGIFIFQERLAPSQWAGLAVAISGLLILALSA